MDISRFQMAYDAAKASYSNEEWCLMPHRNRTISIYQQLRRIDQENTTDAPAVSGMIPLVSGTAPARRRN